MDEQKHRYTRWGGNIGCIAGLVVSGIAAKILSDTAGLSDPQMRLLLVAGVLVGAGIGMVIGRRKDQRKAAEHDAQSR